MKIIWGNCEKKDGHYLQLGSIFSYTLSGYNILELKNKINSEYYILEKI